MLPYAKGTPTYMNDGHVRYLPTCHLSAACLGLLAGFTTLCYSTLGLNHRYYNQLNTLYCRSQWPRGLRRRSAATRLLRSWVRIPTGAWMFVCCECCVLSGRGLCDELITRPEESYRLWCVIVCDLETSRMRRP